MIRMTYGEEARALVDINSILAFFSAVTGYEVHAQLAAAPGSSGRGDQKGPSDSASAAGITSNFPKKQDGMLVVPRGD